MPKQKRIKIRPQQSVKPTASPFSFRLAGIALLTRSGKEDQKFTRKFATEHLPNRFKSGKELVSFKTTLKQYIATIRAKNASIVKIFFWIKTKRECIHLSPTDVNRMISEVDRYNGGKRIMNVLTTNKD